MDSEDNNSGGWSEWRRLIIHELKRLNDCLEKANEQYLIMQQDVTRLKIYSAIYGAVGGIVATLMFQKIIFG